MLLLLASVVAPAAAGGGFASGAAYMGELAAGLSGAGHGQSRYFGLGSASVSYTLPVGSGELQWYGGAWWLHGNNYTNVLGDLNGVSNSAGIAAARLNHLTLEYSGREVRLRAGRFDIDDDFMAFASSDALINSGFGGPATATGNLPLATFPLAGLGALVEFAIADRMLFTGAVFDGDVGAESNDLIGFELGSTGVDGVLLLGQLSLGSGDADDPLRWLVGGAFHTGDFPRLDSGTADTSNGLVYAGVERYLGQWRGREVTSNIRFTAPTAPARNPVTLQFDAGMAIEGLLAGFDNRLSLGVLYVGSTGVAPVGEPAPDDEWVVEVNYRLFPVSAVYVQPTLQYINNRDLAGGSDTLLLMIRFGLEY